MKLQVVLLCSCVIVFASCQSQLEGTHAIADTQIADSQDDSRQIKEPCGYVTMYVCPDKSPHDGCVTLDHLMSQKLIKSNTIFKFEPATFELQQDSVTTFEHVSNITIESAGAYRVNITCVGENSGFIFNNVSGLVIQDMVFTSCMTKMPQGPVNRASTCTLIVNECSNVTLQSLTFKHGISCGVLAINIYGHFTTRNSVFTHMQGPGLVVTCDNSSGLHHFNQDQALVELFSSKFDQYEYFQLANTAFAISITIQEWLPMRIHLADLVITNNTHGSGDPGITVFSSLTALRTIIERVRYTNNHMVDKMNLGASSLSYSSGIEDKSSGSLEIIDSCFINNDFINIPQTSNLYSTGGTHFNILHFFATKMISIKNTTISNNTGWYDAVVFFNGNDDADESNFLIEDSIIAKNNLFVSEYYKKGAVELDGVDNITIHNCSFINNSATGLLVKRSNIYFHGDNIISGNKGYDGGGMALYLKSNLSLLENTAILFEDNVAENKGGGLYVKENGYIDTIGSECFVHVHDTDTISLQFSNNSAKTAGNDWYGGNLYCIIFRFGTYGWQVVSDIIHTPDNYTLDRTSGPLHVCDCSTESSQECIDVVHTIQTVHTYPGKSFNLSLLAVGQLLNVSTLSGVPTAIHAGLLPLHNKSGSIPDFMTVQNGARNCSNSNLTYRVSSSNPDETMVLTINDNIDKIPAYFMMLWQQKYSQWNIETLFALGLTVPAYVMIYLQPCPIGFELLENGICDCSSSLIEHVTGCSIDTMLITKKSQNWISYVNDTEEQNIMYLIHRDCPYDYCASSDSNFSIEDPDAQCDNNHSGIICGGCKPGYSMTLGTNECKQCSNIYLFLSIPLGLAGILLVIFLSLTDITVTAGTINGLLFFANIVGENQATFFVKPGFLSVFIAWLNLDFGISTCLYDGLDAYVFTWLQYAFPLLIWSLAFTIIVASRHFAFMNRVCGRNIVHVLATLFLLSYTKLQRTIVAGLSFTVIDVSNGTNLFVWLIDGNVRYLEGKHIPLFLVSVLFLLALFIPYTLSITFGPWLQSKTHYKVFCWVTKLKPLLDAYFGPMKDKHRYWTGVLLISRLVLSLIISINILGDNDIYLLAVTILTFLLLALLWQSGGVYKIWMVSVLDSFFIINLGVLSLLTLYNKKASKVSDNKQYVTICVSVGSTFAVFCFILLYHCLKKLGLFAAIFKRNTLRTRVPLLQEIADRTANSDDEVLDAIDEGRISYSQTPHAINTYKSCNQDTY